MSVTFKIDVPIVTTGRIGPARKPQVIIAQRQVFAEIAELPATEALIAAEFRNAPHVRACAGQYFRRIADRTVVAGHNWLDANQPQILTALDFYRRRSLLQREHPKRTVTLEGHGPFDRQRPLRDIDRETIRDRDDILIARQMADFEALVPKLRVIGDAIYLRCDEPHIVIRKPLTYGDKYYFELCEEMPATLARDAYFHVLGFYPLTQFDRALGRIRDRSKDENFGQSFPASVLRPEAFSSGFPEANAVILARRILHSFRSIIRNDDKFLPRLHKAGANSIAYLAELSESVDAFMAGASTGTRVTDCICDLLAMDENAPLWSVVKRAEHSELMRFVGGCIDETPIHLDFIGAQSAA